MEEEARDRRRWGAKELLPFAAMMLTVAAIVWRGGEITAQLGYVVTTIQTMNAKLDAAVAQQQKDGTELRVVQERQRVHADKLTNHESRLNALERKR